MNWNERYYEREFGEQNRAAARLLELEEREAELKREVQGLQIRRTVVDGVLAWIVLLLILQPLLAEPGNSWVEWLWGFVQ